MGSQRVRHTEQLNWLTDWLYKMKMQGFLVQKLRLSRWQQQNIKPNMWPFQVWGLMWPHRSHALKLLHSVDLDEEPPKGVSRFCVLELEPVFPVFFFFFLIYNFRLTCFPPLLGFLIRPSNLWGIAWIIYINYHWTTHLFLKVLCLHFIVRQNRFAWTTLMRRAEDNVFFFFGGTKPHAGP